MINLSEAKIWPSDFNKVLIQNYMSCNGSMYQQIPNNILLFVFFNIFF